MRRFTPSTGLGHKGPPSFRQMFVSHPREQTPCLSIEETLDDKIHKSGKKRSERKCCLNVEVEYTRRLVISKQGKYLITDPDSCRKWSQDSVTVDRPSSGSLSSPPRYTSDPLA